MNPLALQSLNHFLLCEAESGADLAELGGQPFGLRARRSHQSSPPWESFAAAWCLVLPESIMLPVGSVTLVSSRTAGNSLREFPAARITRDDP